MAETGILYYYDLTTLPREDVICYYSFNYNSGNIIPNESWAISGYNGLLNSTTSFYSYPGSGNFNGNQYINISGDISLEDWTVLMIYEKIRTGHEILFSSLEQEHGNISGFIIGINDANKLFISYANSVEYIKTLTLPTIISDKNLISITKNNSNVFLGYFNANNKEWESTFFPPIENNFIDSTSWYIGGSPKLPGTVSFTFRNFSGQIDEFLLCTGNLLREYQLIISSGFYSYHYSETGIISSGIEYELLTGTAIISGQELQEYVTIETGFETTPFGETIYYYEPSGISGAFSGIVFTNYSGISDPLIVTGTIDHFIINTGFLNSLGMNEINLFYRLDSDDYVFGLAKTGVIEDKYKNIITLYNKVNGSFYANNNYDSGFFDLYSDGQLQLPSGFSGYDIGYSTFYFLTGDYFLTGKRIESIYGSNFIEEIIFDYYSGERKGKIYFTGLSSGQSLSDFNFANVLVFLNGQLLESGIQYSLPNTIKVNINDDINNIMTINMDTNLVMFSGNTGVFVFPKEQKFLRNSSQVWFNGVRLKINSDYIESASHDLISGNYFSLNREDVIYNSDDNFWNVM